MGSRGVGWREDDRGVLYRVACKGRVPCPLDLPCGGDGGYADINCQGRLSVAVPLLSVDHENLRAQVCGSCNPAQYCGDWVDGSVLAVDLLSGDIGKHVEGARLYLGPCIGFVY